MIVKDVGLTVTVDRTGDLIKAVQELTKIKVMVGIPAEEAEREAPDGSTINNATIGYIQEFGVPEKNIPARPHLVPGVSGYTPRAVERLKFAAQFAFEGRASDVRKQLNAIGLEAVSAVRNIIADGIDPQLSPRTIEARMRRRTEKVKSRARKAGLIAIAKAFPGTMTPLIDFGDYIRHISYVLIYKTSDRLVVTPPGAPKGDK